jgi:hypothetical protein
MLIYVKTLATAAIQLWLSQKPNHTTWTKTYTGIICFVKDYTKKSYFFRLYSLMVTIYTELILLIKLKVN